LIHRIEQRNSRLYLEKGKQTPKITGVSIFSALVFDRFRLKARIGGHRIVQLSPAMLLDEVFGFINSLGDEN